MLPRERSHRPLGERRISRLVFSTPRPYLPPQPTGLLSWTTNDYRAGMPVRHAGCMHRARFGTEPGGVAFG